MASLAADAFRTRLAVERLSALLPLAARQRSLPPVWASLHRAILRSLASCGRTPERAAIAAMLPKGGIDEALARLAADDLIVLDGTGPEVAGAYPLTTGNTPFRLEVEGVKINAMCALDALAVGPMFGAVVDVASLCHVTGQPVRLRLERDSIVHAEPSSDVRVGIAWQNPCGHAAHSLCREMVFLLDGFVARNWQHKDSANRSLFTLAEAVDLATRFFAPLLRD